MIYPSVDPSHARGVPAEFLQSSPGDYVPGRRYFLGHAVPQLLCAISGAVLRTPRSLGDCLRRHGRLTDCWRLQ